MQTSFAAVSVRSHCFQVAWDGVDFARCFGDKGDVEDITEGTSPAPHRSAQQCSKTLSESNGLHNETADIISTVEFDQTGNYLATGDKGGRVVLFERNETVRSLYPKPHCSLRFNTHTEEDLRIQVPHRVPIARARVRLSQVSRNRRKDQQDQVVSSPECIALSSFHK